MAERTEFVSLRLSPDTKKALRELAEAQRRKLADYIATLLMEHVEQARAAKPKRREK